MAEGPTAASARGKVCQVCEAGTLRRVGERGDVTVFHCSTCQSTYLD